MSQLRRLLAEIHRRSIWQVLLVYLGTAYAVVGASDLFTERFGLPEWFFAGAFVFC